MTGHDCSARELVAGKISVPAGELPALLTDSDTGAELHPQVASGADAVDAAVAAAAELHAGGGWSELPAVERLAGIRRLRDELMARTDALARADSLDSGVPLALTTALVTGRGYLTDVIASKLQDGFGHAELPTSIGPVDRWRLPWGPAAVLTPWNGPAPTAILKVADALTAGCPVIVKPSEWAPHFSGPFAEAVEAADLPAGLVQVVHGGAAVGALLVGDPRVAAVSYTGGVGGGTAVAESCARQLKPADLELSGNNPVLALPDADPATVAAAVVQGMLLLNGQLCVAPRRLVVPAARLGDYLAALESLLGQVVLGPTGDPATELGPLANEPHRRHLEGQLAGYAARGCPVQRFGTAPAAGHFFRPAVVVGDAAPDLREEIFGPVLILRTYGEVAEGVAVANDHPYGLTAYVFAADRDEARATGRRLRAGIVTVNEVLGGGQSEVWAVGSAWGASGLGVLGVGEGPDFFTGQRFVG